MSRSVTALAQDQRDRDERSVRLADDRHPQALPPRALGKLLQCPLTTFVATMVRQLGLQHEADEITEVIVDEPVNLAGDLAAQAWQAGAAAARRRLGRARGTGHEGKSGNPADRRGRDLSRIAAEP